MLQILIVEDERPISDLIKMKMQRSGYRCQCAYDGIQAADMLSEKQYDLILLDMMLPGADGFTLMDYIRPLQIPVIIITAMGDVQQRVRGLRAGADDYIVKPFDLLELQARVEAVLRRYRKLDRILEIGGLRIDVDSRTVSREGQQIQLTKKEFDLLLLFARNPGIALYRDTIYERVWESDEMGESRTVDLHIQRLRKKVGWEGKLVAVYKVGYRLEVQ